jgi:Tol biopolymer transport system component
MAVALALGFFAGTRLSRIDAPATPKYQRLTYRRGAIQSARLAPDGRTVIYAAQWDNAPAPELYATRPESPESQKLPLQQPANLLSISRSGEMAILLRVRIVRANARVGTLARISISGGAPREILEDVQDADWAPDGGLAISRRVEGKYRLEYPIGKILYATAGYVSDVRVSPDGERVAFLDHPVLGDNRGSLAMIDRSGVRTTLSTGWDNAEGVAWSTSGAEIWFTAGKGSTRVLYAVGTNGRLREIAGVPASLSVRDIAPDGRVLLQSISRRRGIFGNIAGESRDLSWFDWSEPSALSRDGSTLVITEQGDGGGSGYSIYLRKTDGSPAIRLGEGQAQALSPDGKWVLAESLRSDAAQLMLLPTGAGESKPVTADTINHTIARFSSDGRRVFFLGIEPGHPARVYVQDVTGGTPRGVTPDDVTGLFVVSPDDRLVLARGADQRYAVYPINGGASQPLAGLEPSDLPIRWSGDGQSVIVWARDPTSQVLRLYRVAVAGRRRELLKEIPIPGMLAPASVGFPQVTADAGSYVFSYGVEQSDLFLVEGLR